MQHIGIPRDGRRRQLARALSVLGHPALLMPLAATVSAAARQPGGALVGTVAGVSLGLAMLVMLFGWWQVRRGRWAHVDASVPRERRTLNLLLCVLLFGAAAALLARGAPLPVVLGLALGGALVLLAIALQRWLKLSLHVAFAAFAALLAWPAVPVVAVGLLLALGVAWSRLVLGRHTPRDVVVGGLAGLLAGGVFLA